MIKFEDINNLSREFIYEKLLQLKVNDIVYDLLYLYIIYHRISYKYYDLNNILYTNLETYIYDILYNYDDITKTKFVMLLIDHIDIIKNYLLKHKEDFDTYSNYYLDDFYISQFELFSFNSKFDIKLINTFYKYSTKYFNYDNINEDEIVKIIKPSFNYTHHFNKASGFYFKYVNYIILMLKYHSLFYLIKFFKYEKFKDNYFTITKLLHKLYNECFNIFKNENTVDLNNRLSVKVYNFNYLKYDSVKNIINECLIELHKIDYNYLFKFLSHNIDIIKCYNNINFKIFTYSFDSVICYLKNNCNFVI